MSRNVAHSFASAYGAVRLREAVLRGKLCLQPALEGLQYSQSEGQNENQILL